MWDGLMGQGAALVCVCMHDTGSLRLRPSGLELLLLQVFDLFLLLNQKSSRGRRASLRHNAGIMFVNERKVEERFPTYTALPRSCL